MSDINIQILPGPWDVVLVALLVGWWLPLAGAVLGAIIGWWIGRKRRPWLALVVGAVGGLVLGAVLAVAALLLTN